MSIDLTGPGASTGRPVEGSATAEVDGLSVELDVAPSSAATATDTPQVLHRPSGVRAIRLPRPDLAQDDPRGVLDQYRHRAMLVDGLAAMLASAIAVVARFAPVWPERYTALILVLPTFWILLLAFQRSYEHRFLGSGSEEYRRVVDAGLWLAGGLAVASYVSRSQLSRGWLILVVPMTIGLTLVGRRLLRGWLHRLRRSGRGQHRVLVVGRADAVVSLIEKLDHEPLNGLVPIGACIPNGTDRSTVTEGVPVVGEPDQIIQAVDELGVDVVAVVSHPDLSGTALRRLAWALEEREVDLIVSPGITEVAGPRLSIRPVAGLSLLHLERPAISGARQMLKLVFDRCVGAGIVLLAAPVMLTIAILVKLTSPGPVLFRQTRIGVNGEPFLMLKFRSMVVDAEQRKEELLEHNEGNEMLFKMRDDPRITRVGSVIRRFSLDELPQLFNVLKGDMSLVGPRPPLPEEVAVYSDDATRRLRVRPGMTGLWQVSGRSDLTWEESLLLDLRYVDNWSMVLDLTILWRTGRAVIQGSGAY